VGTGKAALGSAAQGCVLTARDVRQRQLVAGGGVPAPTVHETRGKKTGEH